LQKARIPGEGLLINPYRVRRELSLKVVVDYLPPCYQKFFFLIPTIELSYYQ